MIVKSINQHQSRTECIRYGDFTFLRLHDYAALDQIREKPDAIIVAQQHLLESIRQDPLWYLIPVFTISFEHHLADGVYTPEHVSRCCQKTKALLEKSTAYTNLDLPKDHDQYTLVKALRYQATRQATIAPMLSRLSPLGYQHSHIAFSNGSSDALATIQKLEEWTKGGYLSSKIVDKVNLCHDCAGSYLNFVEVCPKCQSVDLRTEELIHHFRCAYIGPQRDFEQGGTLCCPKCDKQLKHIGIDYDKPSEIHTCQQCQYTGQETTMRARCVDCGKHNQLDQIATVAINAYQITEKGLQLAGAVGLTSKVMTENEKSDIQRLPFKVYEMIRAHEINKGNTTSNHYDVDLVVNHTVLRTLNDDLKIQLLDEICGVIRSYIRTSDLITINECQNIQVFLLEYEPSIVEEIVSTIEYNVNKMMNDNSWTKDAFVTPKISIAQS